VWEAGGAGRSEGTWISVNQRETLKNKMSKTKSKSPSKGSKRGKSPKPFVYLEVCLPATSALRVLRSSGKRDVPLLKKLDAATRKSSGCTHEIVVAKAVTVCLVPSKRTSVTFKTVGSEDLIFEPETVTTTPDRPGGGG
jgi:hypothetical protein